MPLSTRDLLDTAIAAAEAGGRSTLPWFRSARLEVEQKSNNSPVTNADRESEQTIRRMIQERWPDHALLGEEYGRTGPENAPTWVIDPIDGTRSFVRGVPLYGTMVGVEIDGEVVAGAVAMPALGEIYYAGRGLGAHRNGEPIQVSKRATLEESLLLYTNLRAFGRNPHKERGLHALQARTELERSWGDCYGHLLVASGSAEVMLDPGMAVWDAAALIVIVEEAGGVFTSWDGERTIHGKSAVSCAPGVAEEVARLLEEA